MTEEELLTPQMWLGLPCTKCTLRPKLFPLHSFPAAHAVVMQRAARLLCHVGGFGYKKLHTKGITLIVQRFSTSSGVNDSRC